MTILARVARFLVWLLVLSWSMWLLRRVVGWLLLKVEVPTEQDVIGSSAADTQGRRRRLVRDPVCGMHVDERLSIPLRAEGELVHFCSTACRDVYAGNVWKPAANG